MSRILAASPSPANLGFDVAGSTLTFDPFGSLDGLVHGEIDGHPVFALLDDQSPPPFPDFDLLDDRDVPAEVADTDHVLDADRAWWMEQTAAHCPADVPLTTYRAMCDDAGLGPVGFCTGFEPHAEDWPTAADVPLPAWD